ncbi:MAG: response regulator transcription factor [Coriobacteriia bacterium]|nr:response regulator transcription factor [Coriobacteriia bacterium]
MERKSILVVDDEESIAKIVRYALEEAAFTVRVAPDAERGRQALRDREPDLVVLDVMLPDGSGLDLLRELRAASRVPVLMLSARAEEIDRILGLELGADDYVIKPFSPRELVSRVKALLRRRDMDAASERHELRVGDLHLDLEAMEARIDGRPVELTASELRILALLARHPGRVFSRASILDALWGGQTAGGERAVDVHVHNLREKIEDDPARPRRLLTARGLGYRLSPHD